MDYKKVTGEEVRQAISRIREDAYERVVTALNEFSKENAVSSMNLRSIVKLARKKQEEYANIPEHALLMIQRMVDHNRKVQQILQGWYMIPTRDCDDIVEGNMQLMQTIHEVAGMAPQNRKEDENE